MIFIMLVMAPLLISYKTDEMMAKRLILNDVTTFIEMVRDTGDVSQDALDNLYIQCNSHGMAVNVKVKKLVRTEVPLVTTENEHDSKTVYYSYDVTDPITDEAVFVNPGDVIKVDIEEIGISSARKLAYNLLKMDEGKFKFTLAGTVG